LSRGAASVEPLVEAWAGRGFGDTWALDHAGHGASDRLERYRVVDYLEPVVNWISQNINEPICLYGHSLGAMLAPLVAAALPDKVDALVLEDPPFSTMGPRIAESDWYPYFARIAQVAGTWMTPEQLGEVAYRNLAGREVRLKDTRSPEMLAKMSRFLGMLDPRVFDEVLAGRWLEGYEWPGLRHRCLLLQADAAAGGMLRDEDIPAGAELVRMAGVGHLMHWQAPERVLEAMAKVL
jgi:pimeloyl-ACP methyl ester carboxylesterase